MSFVVCVCVVVYQIAVLRVQFSAVVSQIVLTSKQKTKKTSQQCEYGFMTYQVSSQYEYVYSDLNYQPFMNTLSKNLQYTLRSTHFDQYS